MMLSILLYCLRFVISKTKMISSTLWYMGLQIELPFDACWITAVCFIASSELFTHRKYLTSRWRCIAQTSTSTWHNHESDWSQNDAVYCISFPLLFLVWNHISSLHILKENESYIATYVHVHTQRNHSSSMNTETKFHVYVQHILK